MIGEGVCSRRVAALAERVGRAIAEDLGLVFSGGWGDGAELVALDAKTGARPWSVAVEGLNGISIAGARVFATAAPEVGGRIDGRLHAFDARSGDRIWTFKPGAKAGDAPGDEGVVEVRAPGVTVRRGQIRHPGDETRMWQARPVANGEVGEVQARPELDREPRARQNRRKGPTNRLPMACGGVVYSSPVCDAASVSSGCSGTLLLTA